MPGPSVYLYDPFEPTFEWRQLRSWKSIARYKVGGEMLE